MSNLVIILLITYQLKHWLADFPFQTPYMLGKFMDGWDWVLPLLAHVTVHGAFTAIIAYAVTRDILAAIGLAMLDASIHFVMDRIKASPHMLGRYKSLSAAEYMRAKEATTCRSTTALAALRSNTYFWWAIGADQAVHHLTHYLIIWLLVTRN